MNIHERNMTAAIWFLGLWAVVGTICCFGLAQKLGRCEKKLDMAGRAYSVFCREMGGCR